MPAIWIRSAAGTGDREDQEVGRSTLKCILCAIARLREWANVKRPHIKLPQKISSDQIRNSCCNPHVTHLLLNDMKTVTLQQCYESRSAFAALARYVSLDELMSWFSAPSGDGHCHGGGGHVRAGARWPQRAGGRDHQAGGGHGHHPGLRRDLYPLTPRPSAASQLLLVSLFSIFDSLSAEVFMQCDLQWFLLCILYVQQVHIHYLPIVNGQVVVGYLVCLQTLGFEPWTFWMGVKHCLLFSLVEGSSVVLK